jgi:hypothetical protein
MDLKSPPNLGLPEAQSQFCSEVCLASTAIGAVSIAAKQKTER